MSGSQPSRVSAEIENTGPFPFQALHERSNAFGPLLGRNHVDLVQHHPARLGGEIRVVFLELANDAANLGDGIDLRVERREIDEMQKKARALQMAQKEVPEAGAFGGTFDQTR